MKNKLKIRMAAVLLAAAALAFAGCAKDGGGEKTEVIFLSGFETYDEIMHVELSARFGKLERNDDMQFVTEGEHSMLAKPYGNFEKGIAPALTFDLAGKYVGKPDMRNVKYITFDIYNAAAEEKPVSVTFTGQDNDMETTYLPAVDYTLAAGAWNRIVYSFYDGSMTEAYATYNLQKMTITFGDYRTSGAAYEPDSYYIDNLACVEAEELRYAPEREENELLFFEDPCDVNLIRCSRNCAISANANGLYVTQGKISAKVEKSNADNGTLVILAEAIDKEKLANADSFALDLFNGDSGVRYFKLTMRYNDEMLVERQFEVTKVIGANKQAAVEVKKSDLPDGVGFGNATSFELQVAATVCYIDNVRIG